MLTLIGFAELLILKLLLPRPKNIRILAHSKNRRRAQNGGSSSVTR